MKNPFRAENRMFAGKIVKENLAPELKKPANAIFIGLFTGLIIFNIATGDLGFALFMFAYLFLWLQFLVLLNLSSANASEHDKLLDMTEQVLAKAVYHRAQVLAIEQLAKRYEANGKYAIPTDVLLTELNRVPTPSKSGVDPLTGRTT